MAKKTRQFICDHCGSVFYKWSGQCEKCQCWNSIKEEENQWVGHKTHKKSHTHTPLSFIGLDHENQTIERIDTGIEEFNRAIGGGLVPGSATLLGGDPGIGKSTLVLQIASKIGESCAYISGEESIEQIQLRAQRLGLQDQKLNLAASTNLPKILSTLTPQCGFSLVIIDSIQTLYHPDTDSSPGSVSQVRNCALELIHQGKKNNFALILIGHVTKEGHIAGPRVLEHMVDTVLYFEGERTENFRLIRAIKNRFGACDEIGIFDMTQEGLKEVSHPSSLFLQKNTTSAHGACVFASMEGTRPLCVEIQSLVASCSFGSPRRAVVGWDQARLNMILAVLEARCHISMSHHDVYLNIAGGIKISEPFMDLAVAASLLSSICEQPIDSGTLILGEITLSGQIRPPSYLAQRLKEGEKLGFKYIWTPRDALEAHHTPLTLTPIDHIHDLVKLFEHSIGKKFKKSQTENL